MKNVDFEQFLEKYKLTGAAFAKLVHVDRENVLKYLDPEYVRFHETGEPLHDNIIWKIELGRSIIENKNMVYPTYEIKCSPRSSQERYIADCQQHYKDIEAYREKFAKIFDDILERHNVIVEMQRKNIAANLKYLRNKHGYTYVSLGEALGISRGTVGHYEKFGIWDRGRLEQLAKFFEVDVELLKERPDVFAELC